MMPAAVAHVHCYCSAARCSTPMLTEIRLLTVSMVYCTKSFHSGYILLTAVSMVAVKSCHDASG